MITREQALALAKGAIVHEGYANCATRPIKWKVNGGCKVWKKSPERFYLPLKWSQGPRAAQHWWVSDTNNHLFHVVEDCPVVTNRPSVVVQIRFEWEGEVTP